MPLPVLDSFEAQTPFALRIPVQVRAQRRERQERPGQMDQLPERPGRQEQSVAARMALLAVKSLPADRAEAEVLVEVRDQVRPEGAEGAEGAVSLRAPKAQAA